LTAELHYERWACVKAFGKQVTKKLVAGDGVVEVKLTPVVEGGSTVKLSPEIGRIDVDESLGELLRSGSLGDMLREKISNAVLSAMQKGTNFKATLPPAVQDIAVIRGVEFRDAGSRRLAVALEGEVRISEAQVQLLMGQLKR
jgi:hypothetical protein